MTDLFAQLPSELSLIILSHLDPDSIAGPISLVSKRFCVLSQDDFIWQRICLREGLVSSRDDLTPAEQTLPWRKIYAERMNTWDPTPSPSNQNVEFSDQNRTFRSHSNQNRVVFCSRGFSKGVHYWENTVLHKECGDFLIGICWTRDIGERINQVPWLADIYHSVSYNQTGLVYFGPSGKSTTPTRPFDAKTVVGILLDVDNQRVAFFVDGAFQQAVTGLPLDETFFPAVSVMYDMDGVTLRFLPPTPEMLVCLEKRVRRENSKVSPTGKLVSSYI